MNTLQIPVKFKNGDSVYTIKQSKLEKTCTVCEGTGKIKYNNKDMRCPECMGVGKFTTDKVMQTVCEEPFIVETTKISISSHDNASVKYKGRCGQVRVNRAEENLYSTKEEAQAKCDELNKEKIYINICEIEIQDSFKETRPSLDKIQEKLSYYKNNNKFNKNITIDQNKVLQDGYITYLICKMLNIETVRVVVE